MKWIEVSKGREALGRLIAGENIDFGQIERLDDRPSGVDDDEVASVAQDVLKLLQNSKEGRSKDADFEREACVLLRQRLEPSPSEIAERGFWVRLSLKYFSDVIRERHPWGDSGPRFENYGLKGRFEGLILRLWMRGHLGFSPGDANPFYYARLGDVDMWRSHVLRVDHGSCIAVSRAFLKLCFDPTPGTHSVLSTGEIRQLAKRLRRLHALSPFELMSQDQANELVRAEIAKLRAE